MKIKQYPTTRKTWQVRVDKDIWRKVREMLPEETDASISRFLYRTSALRVERFLRKGDKKLSKLLWGKPKKNV